MKLPYTPANILHRHGGRVLEITGIGHKIDRPQMGYSRDYWFYLGRVAWDDGSGDQKKIRQIEPFSLCASSPEGFAEINAVSDLMMEYLGEHGEWCDSKSKHEGWYAHNRKERLAA